MAANYYEIEGSCLKILVAMCHGLRGDDGNPLITFEVEPWKSFPVMQIHPNKDGYTKEVMSVANGASGFPSVFCCAPNDDADLMLERTSPTSAGNNSVMVSLGKSIEKHGQSLIDVARIDAKQKVTLAKMQEEENEKDRMHREFT